MPTRPRHHVAWLLLVVSGLSLAVAWVLASPPGASPDEPAHIAYAWGTVTGQTLIGEHLVTIPGGRIATQVQVPQKLLRYPQPSCYQYDPAKPVTQCSPVPADSQRETPEASYMTGYPPLFYAVEGAVLRATAALGLSGPRELYSARLASAVLSGLALAFGVVLLSLRFPARVVLLATLLGFPATAWFIAASVNPNGLEIAAAFLLAAAVLSVRVDLALGVRSVAAVLAVPLGTLLLAWTRPLSWAWASLILALLLVPVGRRVRGPWRRRMPLRSLGRTAIATTVLVLGSSIVWFVGAIGTRSSEQASIVSAARWGALNPIGRVILLLLHYGTMLPEQIGSFGYLDTPLPTVALVAWVSVFAVAAVAWFGGRSIFVPRWSVGAVLGLAYLAALLDEYMGAWGWQGRYLLPVAAAVCVFAVPGLVDGLERWTASRRLLPWMLVVLMGVNALSVPWFLFRNVYGFKVWLAGLSAAPLPIGVRWWSPPLGQGAVLAFTTVAFACGVGAVWALPDVPAKTRPGSLQPAAHGSVAGGPTIDVPPAQ